MRICVKSLRIIETLDDLFPDSEHSLMPAGEQEKREAIALMESFSSVHILKRTVHSDFI